MPIVRLLVAFFIMAAGAVGIAHAGTAFFALGPLSQVLTPGTDGAWTLAEQDGSLLMSNTTDDGAARYYHTPAPSGAYVVRATIAVAPQAGKFGGGGVLVAFDPASGAYVAAVIEGTDIVAVWQSDGKGVSRTLSTSAPGGVKPEGNAFELTRRGSELTVSINGNEVSTISNDLIGKGTGVGLLGLGMTQMTVSAWSVSPAK